MPGSDREGLDPRYLNENSLLLARNDELANILCEMCRSMEKRGIPIPSEVALWWKERKKVDRAREKAAKKSHHKAKMAAQKEIRRLKKKFDL